VVALEVVLLASNRIVAQPGLDRATRQSKRKSKAPCNDKYSYDLDHYMTFMWHCRLGHINEKRIKKLHEVGLLDNFNIETINACESCLREKMTKVLFSKKGERTSDLLALIHTDICRPMSTYIRNGDRYFITFTDDYSRYGYVYLMRHKSETFEKFKEFRTEVENQLNKSIKVLRLNREGKYLSYEFTMYLKKSEMVSQLTPPGTPQWNSVSERSNQTLLDMVCERPLKP
jgi:GAG-pre-integrase domain